MDNDETELEAAQERPKRRQATRKPKKRPRNAFEPESDDAWMLGTEDD